MSLTALRTGQERVYFWFGRGECECEGRFWEYTEQILQQQQQQRVEMTVDKMDPVEVFAAGEKGRGLRVTKEISAGDVVFAEASFAAVVFDR